MSISFDIDEIVAAHDRLHAEVGTTADSAVGDQDISYSLALELAQDKTNDGGARMNNDEGTSTNNDEGARTNNDEGSDSLWAGAHCPQPKKPLGAVDGYWTWTCCTPIGENPWTWVEGRCLASYGPVRGKTFKKSEGQPHYMHEK